MHKYLQTLLDTEFYGIQRYWQSTDNLRLSWFRAVLNNEPLRDIFHDKKTLYDELPNHFPKKGPLKKLCSHCLMFRM